MCSAAGRRRRGSAVGDRVRARDVETACVRVYYRVNLGLTLTL